VTTAAAAIAFCGYAAFDDRALRAMGIGLATAVLVGLLVEWCGSSRFPRRRSRPRAQPVVPRRGPPPPGPAAVSG